MAGNTPTFRVGQRVVIDTGRMWGERVGTIRSFRWSDDGDDLVVVDFDAESRSGAVGKPVPT